MSDLHSFSNSVFSDFEQWLMKNHTEHYSRELVSLAMKHGDVLKNPSKASEIMVLSIDVRRHVMAGLSNLAKYLGMYQQWKTIRQNAGLKWEKKPSLNIVLDILNSPLKDIMTWLKEVVSKLPMDYGTVLVFNALTGLRVHEGINATRLLLDLDEQNKVDAYLNKELWMLEHFRYPKLFLRKCKNVTNRTCFLSAHLYFWFYL